MTKYFTNFLLDGQIPLSNTLSEIAVKTRSDHKKELTILDSVAGAEVSAVIFSIVNTANANQLDAYKYLEYIFRKLQNLGFAPDHPVFDEYLPWYEQVQKECAAQKKREVCNEPA